jgi:hypothetical protein
MAIKLLLYYRETMAERRRSSRIHKSPAASGKSPFARATANATASGKLATASGKLATAPSKVRVTVRKSVKKTATLAPIIAPIIAPSSKVRVTMRRRVKKTVPDPQSVAATKIINFMRKTKHTRKANYLSTKCPDASVCLALGTYALDIKKQFKGFTSFDYVVEPIKQIGQMSNNGFIKEIRYNHRGYEAYAILKSSQTKDADNLMYEYIVGQYINKLNQQFPCFLETYGYYIYADEADWQQMKDFNSLDVLKHKLFLQDSTNFDDACRYSKYLAVLIQYLSGVQSLGSMSRRPEFITKDLLATLFQIYMPLAMVKDTFTHYDLHLENIQIYEPKKGHYIHYHYTLPDGSVLSFKSSYMAKIIDYGRCYFNDIESGINSKDIFAEVCDAYDCREDMNDDEECGRWKGFNWMLDDADGDGDPAERYYISSQKRNISHDLLPLARLHEKIDTTQLRAKDPLRKMIESLLGAVKYKSVSPAEAVDMGSYYFGTPEILKSGSPKKIKNVQDAFERLAEALASPVVMAQNERDYGDPSTKMGDLMIYSDGRPMVYVPQSIF